MKGYHLVKKYKFDKKIADTSFKDDSISNVLYNYHINQEKEYDEYDNFFKAKIKDDSENIFSKNVHDESYVFFFMKHMLKQLLRVSIKILLLVLIK